MAKSRPVPAVLITGTVGSGKTAVAADIGEAMAERGRPTAIIDLDWLGWAVPLPSDDEHATHALILRNLSAVWPNFRSVGVQYLVLVRAIQSREEVDGIRQTIPEAQIKVVRLTASAETIAERLRRRETGAVLDEHLTEASEFTKVLDEIEIEDVLVANEDRSVREVALEVLNHLDWL